MNTTARESRSEVAPERSSTIADGAAFLQPSPEESTVTADPDRELHRSLFPRMYVRGGLGFGGGERIPLRKPATVGGPASLGPEDSINVEIVMGTELDRELSIEAGLGYQEYSIYEETQEDHYFSKVPLSVTWVFHGSSTALRSTGAIFGFRLGAGIAYYIMPELQVAYPGYEAIVKYKNAFGCHLGIGADVVSQAGWFASLDVKYAFVSFTAREMKENGINTSATYPEWQKIDGSGPLVSIGLGYRF